MALVAIWGVVMTGDVSAPERRWTIRGGYDGARHAEFVVSEPTQMEPFGQVDVVDAAAYDRVVAERDEAIRAAGELAARLWRLPAEQRDLVLGDLPENFRQPSTALAEGEQPAGDPNRPHAMRWDGSRESISAICRWANADAEDPDADDPTVSYLFRDADDAFDVQVWSTVPGGPVGLEPGDWVYRRPDGEFEVLRPLTAEPAAGVHSTTETGEEPVAWLIVWQDDIDPPVREVTLAADRASVAAQWGKRTTALYEHPSPSTTETATGCESGGCEGRFPYRPTEGAWLSLGPGVAASTDDPTSETRIAWRGTYFAPVMTTEPATGDETEALRELRNAIYEGIGDRRDELGFDVPEDVVLNALGARGWTLTRVPAFPAAAPATPEDER